MIVAQGKSSKAWETNDRPAADFAFNMFKIRGNFTMIEPAIIPKPRAFEMVALAQSMFKMSKLSR